MNVFDQISATLFAPVSEPMTSSDRKNLYTAFVVNVHECREMIAFMRPLHVDYLIQDWWMGAVREMPALAPYHALFVEKVMAGVIN